MGEVLFEGRCSIRTWEPVDAKLAKLLPITSCAPCTKLAIHEGHLVCVNNSELKHLENYPFIPEFCPLPDAKETPSPE